MRFTKELLKQPQHCCFIPQIGSGHEKGFVIPDGLFDAWDNRLQPAVSIVALKEIAEKIPEAGLCSKDELTLALAENDALRTRIDELERENSRFEDAFTAIDVLESSDFRARRKAGRKPVTKP